MLQTSHSFVTYFDNHNSQSNWQIEHPIYFLVTATYNRRPSNLVNEALPPDHRRETKKDPLSSPELPLMPKHYFYFLSLYIVKIFYS